MDIKQLIENTRNIDFSKEPMWVKLKEAERLLLRGLPLTEKFDNIYVKGNLPYEFDLEYGVHYLFINNEPLLSTGACDYLIKSLSVEQVQEIITNLEKIIIINNNGLINYTSPESEDLELTLGNTLCQYGVNWIPGCNLFNLMGGSFYINGDNLTSFCNILSTKELDSIEQLYNTKLEEAQCNFQHIEEVLPKVYGENYDIVDGDNDSKYILLYFDKVTVSNHTSSRDIHDLFVRIEINRFGVIANELQGIRMSMTIQEYDSNYTHSHLSSRRIGVWGSWCLGSTDIAMLVDQLRHDFTKVRFEFLLHRIKEYITWESIEGGPYRRLSSVRIGGKRNVQKVPDTYILDKVANGLQNIPLKINKSKYLNQIIVDSTDADFKKRIKELISIYTGGRNRKYYLQKVDIVNNVIYPYESETPTELETRIAGINAELSLRPSITFKGEEWIPKVNTVVENTTDGESIKVMPNEKTINAICQVLNTRLLKYLRLKNKLNEKIKEYEKEPEPTYSEESDYRDLPF